MPGLPAPTDPAWKQAWDQAAFGPEGYLREHPPAFARDREALVDLVRGHAPRAVVLLGSAGVLAPDLTVALPDTLVRHDLPAGFDGLVLAVDWLCHVPAHVVQVDVDGYPKFVHVDPLSGRERLGSRVNETGVPPSVGHWLADWWPLADDGLGARAEVGTGRDAAWLDVVRRMAGGTAVAIEPGHVLGNRPVRGSLRALDLDGGTARPVPDGRRELVADVALDSVAEATGGVVVHDGALTRLVVRP
ncbi:hypothetical protein GCM10027026_22600 [Myroides odoratimimus subsp. xuanwuensis]